MRICQEFSVSCPAESELFNFILNFSASFFWDPAKRKLLTCKRKHPINSPFSLYHKNNAGSALDAVPELLMGEFHTSKYHLSEASDKS